MPVIPSKLTKPILRKKKVTTSQPPKSSWRKPRIQPLKSNKYYLVQAEALIGFPAVSAAKHYHKLSQQRNFNKGPWVICKILERL